MKNITVCVMGLLLSVNGALAQTQSSEPLESSEPSVAPTVDVTQAPETPLPLEKIRAFADIFTRIKANYVEPVSDEKLLEFAIQGMLNGLDPHSSYLKSEAYESLSQDTRGAFNGLGMEVIMEDGFVKVIAPIDDTPAALADIQTGDMIIRIDGKSVSGLSLQEATDQMRGPAGTSITLTIFRESESEPFDVELKRAVVRLNSVKRKRLSDDIGYLRITQFQIATADNFRKQLKMLLDEPEFKGLILDLRNNPGGLLTSAVSVADSLLNGGLIVTTKSRYKTKDQKYEATETDLMEGKPVVVLINGGSASASEIVAGALQDHRRALILGTQSFGKGSVQTVINVGEDEAIKLTTARYYTPKGTSIQAAGIVPDVNIEWRQFKATEKRFTRVTENDLPGHLENDSNREAQKTDHADKAVLAKDYQLNEAFNILKGLLLYTQG